MDGGKNMDKYVISGAAMVIAMSAPAWMNLSL